VAEAGGEDLATAYDLLMFDLDGVVYMDGRAVPQAAESIAAAREAGAHIAFITNNASRTAAQVADHLGELGVETKPADVVTSSQAAARLIRDAHGEGAPIAVLGTDGLIEALAEAGLQPVDVEAEDAVAIVSGYAPEVRWKVVMRAAVRIRNGLPWFATNIDPTLPTGEGPAPGHGAMVAMISGFAGVDPVVAGKPERALFDETLRRVGGDHPLMVGDSLHTDIRGAHAAGVDSLLVMTGVTDLPGLVSAEPDQRPTWIGSDLRALGRHGRAAVRDGDRWRAEGWTSTLRDGRVVVDGTGDPEGWWAVVAAAGWAHLDETGDAAEVSGLSAPDAR
jgi:HAD superfamily hydrolase (TIGR01450 family)